MQAVQRDKAEDFILLGLWASVRIQGVQRLRPTQPGLEGDSDLCPSHVCQREFLADLEASRPLQRLQQAAFFEAQF